MVRAACGIDAFPACANTPLTVTFVELTLMMKWVSFVSRSSTFSHVCFLLAPCLPSSSSLIRPLKNAKSHFSKNVQKSKKKKKNPSFRDAHDLFFSE
jgi:hypothetical protein